MSKATNTPLHLPPFPPCPPIRWFANKIMARAAVSYNIMDDLAQTPTAMYALEVLKTFPTQQKASLDAIDVVDPYDSKLITFDIENGEPRMPSTIAFQIPVSICYSPK